MLEPTPGSIPWQNPLGEPCTSPDPPWGTPQRGQRGAGCPLHPPGGAQSPRQVPPRPLAVTRGCRSRAGDGREVPPWDGEALLEPFGVENGGGKRLAEQGKGGGSFWGAVPCCPPTRLGAVPHHRDVPVPVPAGVAARLSPRAVWGAAGSGGVPAVATQTPGKVRAGRARSPGAVFFWGKEHAPGELPVTPSTGSRSRRRAAATACSSVPGRGTEQPCRKEGALKGAGGCPPGGQGGGRIGDGERRGKPGRSEPSPGAAVDLSRTASSPLR